MGFINPNGFKNSASLEKNRKRILIALTAASLGVWILCALLLPSEVGMQLSATSKLGNYMPKALLLLACALCTVAGGFMFFRNPCRAWLLLIEVVIFLEVASLAFNAL